MLFKEKIYNEVDSTQKLAAKIVKSRKDAHGLVIVAKKQTRGLGRAGHRWESPVGGLYLSTIIQKPLSVRLFHGFSVRLGLEIANLLEQKFALPFKVKWPNDLMLSGKKIGGILIDMSAHKEVINYLIIGIGLNVNIAQQTFSEELKDIATSLLETTRRNVPINLVKELILKAISNVMTELESGQLRPIQKEWMQRSFSYGKVIFAEIFGEEAECLEKGITEKGDLIIELNGKKEVITNGEITIIR